LVVVVVVAVVFHHGLCVHGFVAVLWQQRSRESAVTRDVDSFNFQFLSFENDTYPKRNLDQTDCLLGTVLSQ
jgi:hypothetical protein